MPKEETIGLKIQTMWSFSYFWLLLCYVCISSYFSCPMDPFVKINNNTIVVAQALVMSNTFLELWALTLLLL
jgi:hypothetical protein